MSPRASFQRRADERVARLLAEALEHHPHASPGALRMIPIMTSVTTGILSTRRAAPSAALVRGAGFAPGPDSKARVPLTESHKERGTLSLVAVRLTVPRLRFNPTLGDGA